MKRRNRKIPGVLAVASAAALMVSGWNSASAEPTATATGSTPSEPTETMTRPGLGDQSYTITLITGDRVTYAPLADGRFTVDVHVDPDSGTTNGRVYNDEHGVYVIPDQVVSLIASGAVDRELFNVKYLAENGYADGASKTLPVILSFRAAARMPATQLARAADEMPATTDANGLASIDAAAVDVEKSSADRFWRTLRKNAGRDAHREGPRPSLAEGVSKVWLDRKATVTLDESVPQVGAPDAWARGYDGTGINVAVLDTGIDAEHPDLVGKVVEATSFISGEPVQDGHGHGTHVASTIAGSQPGNRYAGVAPGARLLVGKVCNNGGSCPDSSVIQGMEWAVAQGADVISMSLGGPGTDGTDPMSQAVDRLSASSDALFVIAAGNDGPGPSTVASPGTAPSALTVAAVDKQDGLASFSSRGPTLGVSALKPDIAAPGVAITAARAQGTSLGTPAEDGYTTASGTSMATPHVAGAAAILAQKYPEWTGQEVKTALMSTSVDAGFTAYEQGAGRVDLDRGTTQTLFGRSANVDFGLRPWPHTGESDTRTVTYANTGDSPVVLHLTLSLSGPSGQPAPAGLVGLETDTVTVPAHGTAAVDATLTEQPGLVGRFTGALVASAEGANVRTPVAVDFEEQSYTVNLNVSSPTGECDGFSVHVLGDLQASAKWSAYGTNGCNGVLRLTAGIYMFDVAQDSFGPDGTLQAAFGWLPEVEITGDTELSIDLREARRIQVSTPRPAELRTYRVGYNRISAVGTTFGAAYFGVIEGPKDILLLPTAPVDVGAFEAQHHLYLAHPMVEMSVVGAPKTILEPLVTNRLGKAWADRRRLELVFAGEGTAEQMESLDVKGKLVLVELADTATNTIQLTDVIARHAYEAGAAGLLVAVTTQGNVSTQSTDPIPVATISPVQKDRLLERLRRDRVVIDVEGTPVPPYTYDLKHYEDDRIPESLRYVIDGDDVVTQVNSYHSDTAGGTHLLTRMALGKWDLWALGVTEFTQVIPSRIRRTEYIGPLDSQVGWLTYGDHGMWFWEEIYDEPVEQVRTIGSPVQVPGSLRLDSALRDLPWFAFFSRTCAACREDDNLTPWFDIVGNTPGEAVGGDILGMHSSARLFVDGQQVRPDSHTWLYGGLLPITSPTFELPSTGSTVRLEVDASMPSDPRHYWNDVETVWEFESRQPPESATTDDYDCFGAGEGGGCRPESLILLGYDLSGLALDNTARASRPFAFDVEAYHLKGVPGSTDDLTAEVSFDSGETWREVTVRRGRDGKFQVVVKHPKLAATDGKVTLRFTARDSNGSTVTQTIHDAYGLSD